MICESIYILKAYSEHNCQKNFFQAKLLLQIMHSFFLSRAPTHSSFTFNCKLLYEIWSTRFKVSPSLCEIFNFRCRYVFVKGYNFVQQKAWTLRLSNIIIPFKIKIIEMPHTALLPDFWFLSCNKKFENSVISCMNWSSPQIDLETNFLDLKNWSFEYVTVYFTLTFLYLLTYLFLLPICLFFLIELKNILLSTFIKNTGVNLK